MKRERVRWIFITFLFCATLVIWVFVFDREAKKGVLTVAFFDVGQGDAIFIETPNGTQVLIDGGPNNKVLREIGKQMPFYDRSIDLIITSHPDMDHIGGLPSVLSRFSVENIMIPGVGADTSIYREMLSRAEEKNIEILYARRGRIYLDQENGIYLDVLFPDRATTGFEKNLASVVVKLVYGETTFLFTGDSPASIENYLISVDKDILDVDVLKLGHHGSKTSTSEQFLGYTTPTYAIISAGKDNSYGHPHSSVLALLKQFEIKYLETAKEGTIIFESIGTEPFVRRL